MENMTRINQPQSVSGAFDELLNKMYISNVHKQLRTYMDEHTVAENYTFFISDK